MSSYKILQGARSIKVLLESIEKEVDKIGEENNLLVTMSIEDYQELTKEILNLRGIIEKIASLPVKDTQVGVAIGIAAGFLFKERFKKDKL